MSQLMDREYTQYIEMRCSQIGCFDIDEDTEEHMPVRWTTILVKSHGKPTLVRGQQQCHICDDPGVPDE